MAQITLGSGTIPPSRLAVRPDQQFNVNHREEQGRVITKISTNHYNPLGPVPAHVLEYVGNRGVGILQI